MDMIRFEHPYMLYALALIPVLVLVHYLNNRRRKKLLARLADSRLHHNLAPQASGSRRNWKFSVLVLALAFLVLALSNPQIGSRMEKARRKGVDLIVALDVSNSMLARDIKPNRLTNAKRALNRLIRRLNGDRIGLVIFAGNAYTQLPITTDYAAARMFLESASTDIVPTQGTAIGEAIQKAAEGFPDEAEHNQAIILISDGENHEDNALEITKEVAQKGIVVHTIGMGSPKGAPIPLSSNPGTNKYKQDEQGNTVISQLDQKMLQDIASAGNGTYLTANNARVGVNKLYDQIKKMEEKEFETKVYADYEDRFQYPLALAIIFLLLEFFMFNRKSPWVQKLRIFDTQTK